MSWAAVGGAAVSLAGSALGAGGQGEQGMSKKDRTRAALMAQESMLTPFAWYGPGGGSGGFGGFGASPVAGGMSPYHGSYSNQPQYSPYGQPTGGGYLQPQGFGGYGQPYSRSGGFQQQAGGMPYQNDLGQQLYNPQTVQMGRGNRQRDYTQAGAQTLTGKDLYTNDQGKLVFQGGRGRPRGYKGEFVRQADGSLGINHRGAYLPSGMNRRTQAIYGQLGDLGPIRSSMMASVPELFRRGMENMPTQINPQAMQYSPTDMSQLFGGQRQANRFERAGMQQQGQALDQLGQAMGTANFGAANALGMGDAAISGLGQNAADVNAQLMGAIPGADAGVLEQARDQLMSQGQAQLGAQSNPFQAAAEAQLGLSGQGFDEVAAERLGLLREQSAEQETRQLDSLQNRLMAQGRLGTEGGARQFEAFAKGLGEADLQRQIQAQDMARQLQQDAAGRAQGFAGTGEQLGGNAFARGLQAMGQGAGLDQDIFGRGMDISDRQRQEMAAGYGRQADLAGMQLGQSDRYMDSVNQQFGRAGQMFGAQNQFGQDLRSIGGDRFTRGSDIYGQMNQANQQAFQNALQERNFQYAADQANLQRMYGERDRNLQAGSAFLNQVLGLNAEGRNNFNQALNAAIARSNAAAQSGSNLVGMQNSAVDMAGVQQQGNPFMQAGGSFLGGLDIGGLINAFQ